MPADASVMAKSARVRVQFLETELDLTETLLELARSKDYDDNRQWAIRHGLDTVHRFLPEVASPEDHSRIAKRLEQLEAKVATLVTNLGQGGQ